MIGLLLKDMYSLNKHIKQYGISSVLFIFIAYSMKSSTYLVYMTTMMASMLILTALSNDEMAKWDKYALTMPVARKDMVLSKYVLFSVLLLGGMLISSTAGIIMSHFLSFESSKTIITTGVGAVGAFCVLFSMMLPLLFKYGVEKSRVLLTAVIVLPALLIIGGVKVLEKYNIPIPTLAMVKPYLYFLPAIVLAILFISYKVSVSIYEKKEF